MRKRTLTLIAITMAIMLTASVFAVARPTRGNGSVAAIFGTVRIMKTYDLYRVICESDACCEQGKCLGTVDADTCLSLCGLQFDKPNTEYWVYTNPEMTNLVGYCVNGVCDPVCICATSVDGRVRYTLYVKTRHPDMDGTRQPSLLTSATLCLAAQAGPYVGSDYEQEYYDPPTSSVILPDPAFPDSGQNIILCPMCLPQ